MTNKKSLSKIIEDQIYDFFEKLITYEITGNLDNDKLKNLFAEEYNAILDKIDKTLVNYFHAKADIDASLSKFVKTILPKYVIKRALIRYLFSKDKSYYLDIKLIRVLCQTLGFSPAKILPDTALFRHFNDILYQYYRIKGSRNSIESILRMYLSSPFINIFDVYYIKQNNSDTIQLRTFANNTYLKYNTGLTLNQLKQQTNTWWYDTKNTIPDIELDFVEYRLPYIGISFQDLELSIKKSYDIANNIIMHLLNDSDTLTVVDTIPSLNKILTIREHVVLYLLLTQLVYNFVYSKYGQNRYTHPLNNLFYYSNNDITTYSRPQALIVITNILQQVAPLNSTTAYNISQIIYDNYNIVTTLSIADLENFIISNYPVSLTPQIIDEIHNNISQIYTVTQNLDIYILSYSFTSFYETINITQTHKGNYEILKTKNIDTLFTLINNTINNNINLSEIIYMVDLLYNNNVISIDDILTLILEIEYNILKYVNKQGTFIIDMLYPLLLIIPNKLLDERNYVALLEIIKPIHIKILINNIIILLNDTDTEYVGLYDYTDITNNIIAGYNTDTQCPTCQESYNSITQIDEVTDPSYPISNKILNYRTGYNNSDYNWIFNDHGIAVANYSGIQLDNNDFFDNWSDGDPVSFGETGNSLYCGRCPIDTFQLLEIDTTNNSFLIIKALGGRTS